MVWQSPQNHCWVTLNEWQDPVLSEWSKLLPDVLPQSNTLPRSKVAMKQWNLMEVIFVGPQQALLQGMLRDYGITKWVKSSGMVSRETALQMQRDAHALLFLPWSDISIDGVLTGKIFEYLYSGTPIIAVGGKGMEASQRLLLEAKAGQVLASVEQIKGYLKTKLVSIKKEKSQPDETVLARYDRKILANKLLKIANP